MKSYKFASKIETVVKDAKLEITIPLPLDYNIFNINFSYYCENCFGSGEENTDRPNEGCDDCDSTGRINKSIPSDNLNSILNSDDLKTLKNTLIAIEKSIV